MGKGDRLIVHTPGGGGWGAPEEGDTADQARHGHGGEIGWATRGSWAERISAQASF